MPHITLDYSANMEKRTDIPALCDHLRRAAIETGVFPMPGIRVRAFAATHVSIADGDPEHGYIDISIRLREGRDQETREAATQAIFEAAKTFLQPALDTYSIALSVEMRNIDASLSPKTGTIRDHLTRKG
ncbi:5-carboxymethyl-2-hydroxymuconate Delta-isomerase [Aestuariivita boseongensis]|uniref:5-carboxymethyl-2-hydroxymuconate Delta-isomerase n=1 Tax=Aestuariivita boseongensis TaxID=1470562 RepID=UPI00067FCF99|nr:5-carboxymethyl-2-hydroxymuconate Delta-isomerase [Aestuariivita boseongensis]